MTSTSTLDDYQTRTDDTATYEDAGKQTAVAINYAVLGLVGESGEVADKWKKYLRGDYGVDMPDDLRHALKAELGDSLWYIARLAKEIGFTLSDVASSNLQKLADRKARGAIKGSGDAR